MRTQPEALQLTDALDSESTTGRISNYTGRKAAAELRRLSAVNEELLEALCLAHHYLACIGWDNDERINPIRAAIAKAGEQA
jgi:hypothetical protein